MDKKYINEMIINDKVDGYFVATEITKAISQLGNSYLRLILQDKSGSISAVCFNSVDLSELDTGNIVYCTGNVTDYNEKLQIRISSIRLADSSDLSSFDMADLFPPPAIPLNQVFDKLKAYVNEITDPDYRNICSLAMEKFSVQIFSYPAGKTSHHNRVGGLGAHMLGVIIFSLSTLPMHPQLNKSLLIAGALLHDIGKITEYNISPYGLFADQTNAGKLLGHVEAGISLVTALAMESKMPNDKRDALLHIIASHHSKSGVAPILPEAVTVAEADTLDCKLDHSIDNIVLSDPAA